MSESITVLGASGFVGRATVTALRRRGVEVRPVVAPRLRWPADWPHDLAAVRRDTHREVVDGLARRLQGSRAVVNAAGLPEGTAPATPGLYGANALLPALLSRACMLAGVARYVHVSSAVVQGGRILDETSRTAPFSPYSHSKALGERLLLAERATGRVIFRATWVHDAGRPNTRALVRLARSLASSVAGDGSAPTPHVLIDDLALSVIHLALAPGPVPDIAIQPANGMTTGLLLRLLGGREPRRVAPVLARAAVRSMRASGRLWPHAHVHARRAEMVLFGRRQVRGWLCDQRVVPPLRPEAWLRLATSGAASEGV
jgi:UDP-glucose 4-epimerase